jgi:hypothetical protein
MKVAPLRPSVYEIQPDPQRVLLSVGLEPWPDSDWLEAWRRDRQFPPDLHAPWIAENALWFEVERNEDIPRIWSAIKTRIEMTNYAYATEVQPLKDEAARREQEAETAEQRRLEDARRIVSKLK